MGIQGSTYRGQLTPVIANEFDEMAQRVNQVLDVEHKDDGTHENVTVDSLIVAYGDGIAFEPPPAAAAFTGSTDRKLYLRRSDFNSIVLDDGALGGYPDIPLFYIRTGIVAHNALLVTSDGGAFGTTTDGSIKLLGTFARFVESAYSEGIGYYTDYPPTWASSGTQPTNGQFSIARYTRVGDDVSVEMRMNMDGTTTFGTGTYTWTLPVTAATSGLCQGAAELFDSGTNFRIGVVQLQSTTTFGIVTDAATNNVGATNPFTFAANDYITVRFSYKAA